jgi:hypothetical protein
MVQVVSASCGGVASVWLDVDGEDIFVEKTDMLAVWEPSTTQAASCGLVVVSTSGN